MNKEYKGFALCFKEECVLKDKCERAKGFRTLGEDDTAFLCVNPMATTGDENCPMVKIAEPVRMAYGFIGLLDKLPYKISKFFASELRSIYGKSPYYERRNGNLGMSPEEQRTIVEMARKMGAIVEDEPFDRYETKDVF